MKNALLTLCMLLLCNFAFAEVGPLTQATQKYFSETGECYFKFYGYMNEKAQNAFTKPRLKDNSAKQVPPSEMFEYTKGGSGEAYCLRYINKFKSSEGFWFIKKNEKKYQLSTIRKMGIRKDLKDLSEGEQRLSGDGQFPISLSLVLPDTLLPTGSVKYLTKNVLSYDGSTNVDIDRVTYQCEQYSISGVGARDTMSPFAETAVPRLVFKLFFKEGKLVRIEYRERNYDVEINNIENIALLTVPKGYTIYADNSKSMSGLLKKKPVVLEQY